MFLAFGDFFLLYTLFCTVIKIAYVESFVDFVQESFILRFRARLLDVSDL
jgi:hypothetical protein